ncbi:MAG: hypothetical protein FWC27_11195 [Firmicutes bacterium]|nr:hypothetical protein [Bacillota bacterium]
MQNETRIKNIAIAHLAGCVVLALAVLASCGILAKALYDGAHQMTSVMEHIAALNPGTISARIEDIDTYDDYMPEGQARYYIGYPDSGEFVEAWETLLESGALDGAFTVFEAGDDVQRVFSKAKLDEWMQARIAAGRPS